MENQMLCYQCASTKDGKCCNDTCGACGKTAVSSRLRDELTGALVGLAKASVHKSVSDDLQRLMVEGLAATAAHTDFDDERIIYLTEQIKAAKKNFIPKFGDHNASLKIPEDFDIRVIWQKSPDIRSLKSLLLFGVRGIALYTYEALTYGQKNKEAYSFFHKALIALSANHFKEDYYEILKEMGGIALRAMEFAGKAKTSAFGTPTPVEVPRIIEQGPFLIVSGHDFTALKKILDQTQGTGINVYSHGEMLPAHAYPEFRKYPHFKGHYGTGWQNQWAEFDHIPAAIIFTSNCLMLPLASYADRIFTTGIAHIGGIPYLAEDFSPAIRCSMELNGAPQQIPFPGVNGGLSIRTGFGKKSMRTLGYKLAAAMAEGKLHHIYVMGGCDGNEQERTEYTDLARRVPDDAVILTWGCAKYRFNDIDYGEIGGVPRIIDIGQCGDLPNVVEAVETIAASAKLRTEELPLKWYFSWQEQRSVANFFALLSADIGNFILSPSLPPFFTESVFAGFAKEYGISLLHGTAIAEEPAITEELPKAKTYELTNEKLPDFAIMDEEELAALEKAEEEEAAISETLQTAVEPKKLPHYTAEEIDERADAAGLPDWAIADDDDDEYEEETENFDSVNETKTEEATTPQYTAKELDERAEAAGLPDWAIADDDDYEEDSNIEISEADPAVIFAVESNAAGETVLKIRPEDFASGSDSTTPEDISAENIEEEEEERKETAETDSPAMAAEVTPYAFKEDTPIIALPKGKGVSGWKDPDDEPAFKPGQKTEPYRYTPPKELREIEAPPPIVLPEGAGVSGFAANKENNDHYDDHHTEQTLYAFSEPLPEIKIPKGKGVSGWKEEDDEFKPHRSSDSEKTTDKPWLKKSLDRLHAEVEADNKAPEPIPSAVAPLTAETEIKKEVKTEITPSAAENSPAENSDKPWLAASLKQLKESLAADEAAEEDKNSDKPWLKQSLAQLHAEVEAENGNNETTVAAGNTGNTEKQEEQDEQYISSYRHDAKAAENKPWLKTSIEELKESIDRDAGIKTVRKSEPTEAGKEKSAAEVAAKWQQTETQKSWQELVPTTVASTEVPVTATPFVPPAVNTANSTAADSENTEPSGGAEPPAHWQKPSVLPKPWDKDLQTTWQKPEVLPKPWEQKQPAMYHNPNGQEPQAWGNTEQSPSYEQEQQAYIQQQQISAEQQVYAEQQQLFAAQQAYAQQQQQLAEQQAYVNQQWQNQQAYAEAQAKATAEAEQRVLAAQQDIAVQAARLQYQAEQLRTAEANQQEQARQMEMQARNLYQQQQAQAGQIANQLQSDYAEQQAYAEQLRYQAEQLRLAEEEQNARNARLQQQAAEIQSVRVAQNEQAARLYQQEQQLYRQQQAYKEQQTLVENPYQFAANAQDTVDPRYLSPNAGTSGYRQPVGFIPGQERPEPVNPATAIQMPQQTPTPVSGIPMTGGTSGSRYYEAPPTVAVDYSQTCYGVPQTTIVPMPAGSGVSGWADPNPPIQQPQRQSNDFFGFMNSTAPAGVNNHTEIITPGNNDEFIATKGPDGEVTLTIRADKK